MICFEDKTQIYLAVVYTKSQRVNETIMSMEQLYFLGFTILVVLVSMIYQVINSKMKRKQISAADLPPGKQGWPLIGETLEYLSRPEQFITDRMMKFSPNIFKTSILGENVVVLCGSSANKFLFTNESKLFTFWMHPALASALALQNIPKTSLSSKLLDEELHKLLKMDNMHHLIPIMSSVVLEHLQENWAPFDEVKAQPLSKHFTFALSFRILVNSQSPHEFEEFRELFFRMHDKTMSKSVSLPFYKATKVKDVIEKLKDIMSRRKTELPENVDEESCRDLLGRVLLSSHKKEMVLNYDEIAGRINSLLFASFYTISTTITFLLGHLAQYPHIYSKVLQEQMEIAELNEMSGRLSWKDIQKMKYSWNVVCESMRLKPPALGSYREAITDFTYAGFHVPKGWKVRQI
ncbi:hypothetical protein KSS87_017876 [Heliosperma pusillum]|nr:hypothetical protein KSS87_017876 [Heliosperma pusillum]